MQTTLPGVLTEAMVAKPLRSRDVMFVGKEGYCAREIYKSCQSVLVLCRYRAPGFGKWWCNTYSRDASTCHAGTCWNAPSRGERVMYKEDFESIQTK
jgi:hypothetical protein